MSLARGSWRDNKSLKEARVDDLSSLVESEKLIILEIHISFQV
jgi:hypothetical protein